MTTVVFYQDSNCLEPYGANVTGPPTGLCTNFGVAGIGSFRVETLERTCAVTIYDSDLQFCSSSTLSVANFGICYSNTTVNQLSTDCQDFNIATSEPAASFIAAPTRSPTSTSPSSTLLPTPTTTTTPNPASTTATLPSPSPAALSTGAIAGIAISSAIALLSVLSVLLFFLLRRRRRARKNSTGTPNGSVQELHGSCSHHPVEMSWHERDKKAAADEFAMRDFKHAHGPHNFSRPGQPPQPRPVAEVPGDSYWPGGVHEMDGNSVRTYEVSSPTEGATNLSTNTQTSVSRVS